MRHRERVFATLEHHQPDRLPLDPAGGRFTGIMRDAHDALREHLGFGEPGALVSRMGQTVAVAERPLRGFDFDVHGFPAGSRDKGGDEELGAGRYRGAWGVIRRQLPRSVYYDTEVSPLSGDIAPGTIVRYPWPDPAVSVADHRDVPEPHQGPHRLSQLRFGLSAHGGSYRLGDRTSRRTRRRKTS